jgi:large subunit ribosomal protein L25
MAEVRLKALVREGTGKGASRRTRAGGRVPAIVYGQGMAPVSISVDRREFVTALHTDAGMNVLLDLEINGDTTLALTRELQRDPVRGTLLHADFVKIDRTQEVEVEVPVHLVGDSPGVKEGGVLENPLFQLHVRSLPGNVPESIEADISGLAIGDSLRVADLVGGRDFEILNDPDAVVASVAAPISEAELEALEAEAGAVAEEGEAATEAAPTEATEEAGTVPEAAEGAGGDAAESS